MKLVSFSAAGKPSWGVVIPAGVIDLVRRFGGRFPNLRAALAADALREIARETRGASADFGLEEVKLLPPVPNPEKVICIGLNYKAHVGEGGGPLPEFPSLFTRFADTLVGHEEPLVLPKLSKELDYECELALVIGRGGRHIRAEDAMRHIAGYCCFNDASVRDYQVRHSLPAGKNFFATGPLGPWLVTSDEIADPGALSLRTLINGEEFQHGNTRDLIFDIPTIIAYVSGFTPLAPGDVIATGTPEGVGFLRNPPVFLEAGDVVEIEIEGIGVLRNPVVAEA
jgi:2-keto-4-pentenoate hydratase/2-oxohepta-3-ene-1,7-dioic acid hydratase in catechol pathway